MEFVFELIVHIILSYPGAFFRWMIFGFRKPFKYYDSPDDVELNAFIGIVFAAAIFLAIHFFK